MIINKSDISDKKIQKLIEFCTPSKNFKLCDITFKNTKSYPYAGEFYYGGWQKPYIILRFDYSNKDWYPIKFNLRSDKILRTGYAGKYNFDDFWQMAVFTLRHEMEHLKQYRENPQWLYHDLKKCEKLGVELRILENQSKIKNRRLLKTRRNLFPRLSVASHNFSRLTPCVGPTNLSVF